MASAIHVRRHGLVRGSESHLFGRIAPSARVRSRLFGAPAWAERRRALAGPSRPPQGEGGVAEHRLPQLLTQLPQTLPLIRILGRGRYPHRRGIALHSP
jgi:hypothetical protein